MEYIDAYDENRNYLGKFDRDYVHENGLWHNTIHCWLYDDFGNVYFQIRSDANKLYTTASGHVSEGETLPVAFGREVKEEIGIDVNYEDAELLDIVIWKMDKEKNGKVIKDRAFSNVYILCLKENSYNFSFDDDEVIGVVKVNASDTLELFHNNISEIIGEVITTTNKEKKTITKDDFLLMPGEDLISKYGSVLEAIRRK